MSLISNGISSVRAFSLPSGIWEDGSPAATSRAALVQWRSVLQNVYYQVYVNGQYAGTTLDRSQRQMIVPIPDSLTFAVHIEVFAVQARDTDIDFGNELYDSFYNGGRVKISMLRSQDLPPDATLQIYFDNSTGQIDYENPLNDQPIHLWPAWQDKAGFGMSRLGFSDFGYDSSAAVGFGRGSFGNGMFGLDADTIEWISPSLDAGVFKFAVIVADHKGNESSVFETGPITVMPAPSPAEGLEISSFNQQTNELVLKIL